MNENHETQISVAIIIINRHVKQIVSLSKCMYLVSAASMKSSMISFYFVHLKIRYSLSICSSLI